MIVKVIKIIVNLCTKDHTPNEITKKALDNAQKRKGLKSAQSTEELFDQLQLDNLD